MRVNCTGFLPEQVWDADDIPEAHMYCGRATGSAMPLMWSHSEYIKLLRSAMDGKVYDYIPEVGDRYQPRANCKLLEVWKLNRQIDSVKLNYTLRIQKDKSFTLRWSKDEWQTSNQTKSISTSLSIEYVDIFISPDQTAPIEFSFLSDESSNSKHYRVSIEN